MKSVGNSAPRKSPTVVSTEDFRLRVLEIATTEAKRYVLARDFEKAVGAGLCGLKSAVSLYGPESPKLVEFYFLLSESNLGIRKFEIAREFLQLAQANINAEQGAVAKPTDQISGKISLNRILGKLQLAQGNPKDALTALASAVFYSGELYGPESVPTCTEIANLAEAFHCVEEPLKARHCLVKVLESYESGDKITGSVQQEVDSVMKVMNRIFAGDEFNLKRVQSLEERFNIH